MKEYGLIGYPLSHSFSQQFFTEKFESENLADCKFSLFPLQNISEVGGLLAAHPHLKGLAVTIPYKEIIIPFLDIISDEAKRIGAVNCLQVSGTEVTGYNTDVTGFEESFRPLLQPHHTRALVLGSGGASKAVRYVLNKLDIPFLVVSRDRKNNAVHTTYEELNEQVMKQYSIVINCTPMGMYPEVSGKPGIPYGYVSPQHYLYDLVYNPVETAFLQEGKRRGAVIKNGLEMLHIQALANWEIWNQS